MSPKQTAADAEAGGLGLIRVVDIPPYHYGAVFATCRAVVEGRSFRLREALAEAIADEVLGTYRVGEVVVRVRKLRPPIEGTLGWAGVEVVRTALRDPRGASPG